MHGLHPLPEERPATDPARLFRASFLALVTTAMTFAIRGDIMGDLEEAFALSKVQLGWISGAAFWGFGLAILFGGPLCEVLGMGRIIRVAACGHVLGVLLTMMAQDFTVLFAATVVVGIANGLVEASINPLVATVYPREKIARLTALHAGFPGGIVIGGVLAYAFTHLGLGWQAKMALLLIPAAAYWFMFSGQGTPQTERKAAGVSLGGSFRELARPLFIAMFLCMWLTAATELGPGQWVGNIFNDVMAGAGKAGVLVLVWINGIMWACRQFGRGVTHVISPLPLIATTAVPVAAGLWLFGQAQSPAAAFAAAALLAVGTAFWWPTMLGVVAERFPRGGALALAVIGAAGSFSTAIAGPVMGWINDTYGPHRVLPIWAGLPAAIVVIFAAIHFIDQRRSARHAAHRPDIP
jgi:MFS family permease